MTPLIDGDILLHEIGWSSEFKDKDTGEPILFDWDKTELLLTEKIKLIEMEVGATAPPVIFLSDSKEFRAIDNRLRKFRGEELIPFTKNFRYEVAKTKPYKGNRKNPKPFHFHNISSYLLHNYETIISSDGYEADDEIAIYQMSHTDTIICSRDKDLRICPGHHYSWECGGQRSIGPEYTDRLGRLYKDDRDEVIGYGMKFFYFQMLAGDAADNIPGLPGKGKAFAFKLLEECKEEREMFELVQSAYKEKMGDQAKEYFREQADLLWIVQERGKRYSPPKKGEVIG